MEEHFVGCRRSDWALKRALQKQHSPVMCTRLVWSSMRFVSKPFLPGSNFSLPCTSFSQIYSGRIPFHDIHDMKAILEIVGNGRPIRDFEIPDDLWQLTAECWAADPLCRPRIEDVVAQLSTATSEN
jgi:hypothetical protein